jgi:uncharacterized protein YpmS
MNFLMLAFGSILLSLHVVLICLIVFAVMRFKIQSHDSLQHNHHEEEILTAFTSKQLDSLLVNAIENRLDETEIDEEMKASLADDFIMIAISYGDGRVRREAN